MALLTENERRHTFMKDEFAKANEECALLELATNSKECLHLLKVKTALCKYIHRMLVGEDAQAYYEKACRNMDDTLSIDIARELCNYNNRCYAYLT